MLRKLLIPLLILLIPTLAFASPVIYHRLGANMAPYEPVAVAQPDMLFETADLLTVDFLDHGAADCILLRIDGETMLVDGASLNQFGFIRDELAALDVKHFNYMVNTHAHKDHIDGLIAILKRDDYQVDAYLSCYTDDYPGSEEYTRVRELLTQRDIPYYRIAGGDHFMLGQAYVAVFRDETPGIDKNRHSLVLKISFGDRSVLLYGRCRRRNAGISAQPLRCSCVSSRCAEICASRDDAYAERFSISRIPGAGCGDQYALGGAEYGASACRAAHPPLLYAYRRDRDGNRRTILDRRANAMGLTCAEFLAAEL